MWNDVLVIGGLGVLVLLLILEVRKIPAESKTEKKRSGTEKPPSLPPPDPELLQDETFGSRYYEAIGEAQRAGIDPRIMHDGLHRAFHGSRTGTDA